MRLKPENAPPQTLEKGGRVWVLVPEAARRLGITTGRIYHLTSSGRMPFTEGTYGLIYVREDAIGEYASYQRQLAKLRTTRRPLRMAMAG